MKYFSNSGQIRGSPKVLGSWGDNYAVLKNVVLVIVEAAVKLSAFSLCFVHSVEE